MSSFRERLGMLILCAALAALLTSCGYEDSIGALIQKLSSEDVADRRRAAGRLREKGGEAVSAIPALVAVLDDPDRSVRLFAVQALGAIGTEARDAVPYLVRVMHEDVAGSTRTAAAQALGAIRAPGGESIEGLVSALRGERIRPDSFALSVAKFGRGAAPAAVGALVELVEREGHSFSVWALGQIGPAAKSAVSVLVDVLEDAASDVDARAGAAWALGQMGEAAREAIPALKRAEQQGVPSAEEALKAIGES